MDFQKYSTDDIASVLLHSNRQRGKEFEFPEHHDKFTAYNQLQSKVPYHDEDSKLIYPILTDYLGCIRSISDVIPSGNAKIGQNGVPSLLKNGEPGAERVSCFTFFLAVWCHLGGPSWKVKLGRRDSTTANRAIANVNLPSPFMDFPLKVRFAKEVIGEGIGRTRREAHHLAAMESLMNLAACLESSSKPTHACRALCGAATENADSDSDLEVVENISVNQRCPISGARMKIVRRTKPCAHMGCFDLEVFVEMNQRSPCLESSSKPTHACRALCGAATENADSDSDLEVVENISVNQRCPISGARMKIVRRTKPCAHMGCFDLEVFVEMNQRSHQNFVGSARDADFIVSSDSDDEDENLISSEHIYKNNNPKQILPTRAVSVYSIHTVIHNLHRLEVKENQEKDKIGSKPDKNGKRGEAGKSQKQLQLKEEEKPKKTKKRMAENTCTD
nr:E3 SUMO-protein ligase SIZ1-like [Tanacetum cinerariifolium]